jgi:hypothetical protein
MNFDLQKKAAQINTILLDKGIKNAPTMRVGIALDISGSMGNIIGSGALQKAFNQMMGVSVKFDDNGELDVFKFDTSCTYVGTSEPVDGDYDRFVEKNGIRAYGGTSYAPIVAEATRFFFQPKKKGGFLGFGGTTEPADNTPVLMLVLTDGEPSDAREAERALAAAQNQPIYFHFVGVGAGGRRAFPTIAHLADALPNVGEVYLENFNMPDSEVYNQLICDELVEWIGGWTGGQRATA